MGEVVGLPERDEVAKEAGFLRSKYEVAAGLSGVNGAKAQALMRLPRDLSVKGKAISSARCPVESQEVDTLPGGDRRHHLIRFERGI